MYNLRLDPTTPGGASNPNQFLFSQDDFEEVLLDLHKKQKTWQPVSHIRQRYIRELARRKLPVPDRVLLDSRDQWVKSFITSRLKDPDAKDLPKPADEPLEISNEHPQFIEGIIGDLLKAKKGVVVCAECRKSFSAGTIKRRKWDDGGPPLASAGGTKFKCPAGHVLLQTVEWIS